MRSDDLTLIGSLRATPVPSAATLDAVLAAIESILPTAPLIYRAVGEGLTATVRPVKERAQWLRRQMTENESELFSGARLYSGMEDPLVFFEVSISKQTSNVPGGKLASMELRLPGTPAFAAHVLELVRVLGPLTGALKGEISPVGYFSYIKDRFIADHVMLEQPDVPDDGLPSEFTHLAMPSFISWVNYWSAETCRLIGITAESPELRVFHRVLPCDGGGLALQLTEEPLDLGIRPDHVGTPEYVAAVEVAYAALPVLNTGARFDSGRPRIRNMQLDGALFVDLCTFVVGPTWIDAGIAAIEAALPTGPLNRSMDRNGYLEDIAHPGAWVAERMANQEPGRLCNGDKNNLVWLDTFSFVPESAPVPGDLRPRRLLARAAREPVRARRARRRLRRAPPDHRRAARRRPPGSHGQARGCLRRLARHHAMSCATSAARAASIRP